ncbi:MAG: extracellular solute-binding protein [Anaerolineae bacterium]|nr:extracellular solute-binding protein [Anaerolineae bacterium]
MKKTLLISILVVLTLLLAIVPATAQSEPTTIKIFTLQRGDGDIALNTFSLALEEMFNVKFEWTFTAFDSSVAKEQRNLALASGDYPDLFMLVDWIDLFSQLDLLKYGQQGVIIPLNDLIDQHAPNIKAALDSNATFRAMSTAPDGTIWGLGMLNECYHCLYPNKMWVNSKWLKALNIATPTTTEDFKNMLIAFQTQDANGNGEADEILAGANAPIGTRPIPYLMNGFIYDDDRTYLMVNEGKVDTVATTQEWKDGLTYIKSLYDAGLIDPSAFTGNLDVFSAVGNNATAQLGSAVATLHPWQFTNCAADANPAYCQDYDPIPPLQGPNAAFATIRPATAPGATFVLTNKASPEVQIAAIKMLDYMFTFEGRMAGNFGLKDINWRDPLPGELANNQSVEPAFTVIPVSPFDNNAWGPAAQYNFDGGFRDSQVQSDEIYTPAGYEHRLQLASDLYSGSESPNAFPFWNIWPDLAVADELALLRQNINDYIESSQLAFVTGSMSLETDWDSYVEGLNNLGLARYLEIQQAGYDASVK